MQLVWRLLVVGIYLAAIVICLVGEPTTMRTFLVLILCGLFGFLIWLGRSLVPIPKRSESVPVPAGPTQTYPDIRLKAAYEVLKTKLASEVEEAESVLKRMDESIQKLKALRQFDPIIQEVLAALEKERYALGCSLKVTKANYNNLCASFAVIDSERQAHQTALEIAVAFNLLEESQALRGRMAIHNQKALDFFHELRARQELGTLGLDTFISTLGQADCVEFLVTYTCKCGQRLYVKVDQSHELYEDFIQGSLHIPHSKLKEVRVHGLTFPSLRTECLGTASAASISKQEYKQFVGLVPSLPTEENDDKLLPT